MLVVRTGTDFDVWKGDCSIAGTANTFCLGPLAMGGPRSGRGSFELVGFLLGRVSSFVSRVLCPVCSFFVVFLILNVFKAAPFVRALVSKRPTYCCNSFCTQIVFMGWDLLGLCGFVAVFPCVSVFFLLLFGKFLRRRSCSCEQVLHHFTYCSSFFHADLGHVRRFWVCGVLKYRWCWIWVWKRGVVSQG